MGGREIEPSEELEVRVEIRHLEGTRIGSTSDYSSVRFDIQVEMKEEERRGEELTLSFRFSISTKPPVAKFEVGGRTIILGPSRATEAVLEVDPETQVPTILYMVYQKVFTSLFLLSSFLDSPCPPPDLLYTSKGRRTTPMTEEPEQPESPRVEDQAVVQEPQEVEAVKQG